ncbi:hypothetical protein [Sporohalobacter salinus]|uniref:hypothetical protein n=1 Tax=Sporohalobacter salinus TaxID=1494606 RepID=UPI001960115D|nr:hypothetical protein [Sporohalobacter salinus]MBM7624251.1 hypothetical protein [Sporohalobacter salinus]
MIFPVDSTLALLKYENNWKNDFLNVGGFSFEFGKTIANDDDVSGFEDSDWTGGGSKDVYSIGDVDIDSEIFDLKFRFDWKAINENNNKYTL